VAEIFKGCKLSFGTVVQISAAIVSLSTKLKTLPGFKCDWNALRLVSNNCLIYSLKLTCLQTPFVEDSLDLQLEYPTRTQQIDKEFFLEAVIYETKLKGAFIID